MLLVTSTLHNMSYSISSLPKNSIVKHSSNEGSADMIHRPPPIFVNKILLRISISFKKYGLWKYSHYIDRIK